MESRAFFSCAWFLYTLTVAVAFAMGCRVPAPATQPPGQAMPSLSLIHILLVTHMPKNWQLYQHIMLADAATFEMYNANMRSLVVERLSSAEMVLFNRCSADTDKMALHRICLLYTSRCV